MVNRTESESEISIEEHIETDRNEIDVEKQANESWRQSTIDGLKENMITTDTEREWQNDKNQRDDGSI